MRRPAPHQFGLMLVAFDAEEVAKIYPELVIHDEAATIQPKDQLVAQR